MRTSSAAVPAATDCQNWEFSLRHWLLGFWLMYALVTAFLAWIAGQAWGRDASIFVAGFSLGFAGLICVGAGVIRLYLQGRSKGYIDA